MVEFSHVLHRMVLERAMVFKHYWKSNIQIHGKVQNKLGSNELNTVLRNLESFHYNIPGTNM